MSGINQRDLEFLESRLKEQPDSMMFARLADYYLEMDRKSEAIALCEDGIKKHPYYATGHFVLGKSYLVSKMYEEAEKEFKRVLLFDPKYLAAHKLYGDLMREIGWENTCVASYKKILQIDPLEESAAEFLENNSEVDEPAASAPEAAPAFEPEPEASSMNESEPAAVQPQAPEEDIWPYQPPAQTQETGYKPNLPEPFSESEDADSVQAGFDIEEPVPQATEPAAAAPPEPAPEPASAIEEVGPMPVTPEEEELMFKEPEPLAAFPEEQVEEAQPEPEAEEVDEQKVDEFSYILDDIFRDGGDDANGQSFQPSAPPTTGLNDDIDIFLGESQAVEPEAPETSFKPQNQPEDVQETQARSEPEETPPEPQPMPRPTVIDELTPFTPPAAKEGRSKKGRGKKQGDKIVTPTLGEIYAAQGQYGKAIDVFETLIKKYPDNEFYKQKIDLLRKKMAEVADAPSN